MFDIVVDARADDAAGVTQDRYDTIRYDTCRANQIWNE